MTDDELSRAVALACGWTEPTEKPWQANVLPKHWWQRPGGGQGGSYFGGLGLETKARPPSFSTSLDACFGPGGPVEDAKAKGWRLFLDWDDPLGTEPRWMARVRDAERFTPTAPRSICEAFLAAIQAQP